jgi:hypothetical protein
MLKEVIGQAGTEPRSWKSKLTAGVFDVSIGQIGLKISPTCIPIIGKDFSK